ncbi:MAG TPA: recombinase RecT [Gemmatimonadales bacterium]|nr:recombinase RecT [Gemmatimonadales bacterium]
MTTAQNQTALAVINPANVPIALQVFGEERLQLLKEQIGRGWREPMTDAELEHIGLVCQRSRLDPLVKPAQIYFIKRYDSKLRREVMTPQVSIDGLRLIAQRSREYGGATPYLYCGPDGVWKEMWLEDGPPAAAKVGVKRRGWKDYLWAVATWKEWRQEVDEYDRNGNKTGAKKLAPFWESKAAHMLGKTAEAIALKRAFPEETNDLELAAIDQEWRTEQVALARRYSEIMGSEETSTFYDLPAPAPASPELPGRGEAPPAEPRRPDASGPRSYAEVFDEGPPAPTDAEVAAPRDVDTGEVLEPAAPAPERPRIAGWQRNRQLVAEAQKRKLTGFPTLNARSSLDVVEAANQELEERIRNYDLDQKLAREQETFLA